MMTRRQIAKLFALAGSDNNAEAIEALRAIRRQLEIRGRDWNDLVDAISVAGLFVNPPDPMTTKRTRSCAIWMLRTTSISLVLCSRTCYTWRMANAENLKFCRTDNGMMRASVYGGPYKLFPPSAYVSEIAYQEWVVRVSGKIQSLTSRTLMSLYRSS